MEGGRLPLWGSRGGVVMERMVTALHVVKWGPRWWRWWVGIKDNKEQMGHICMSKEIKGTWIKAVSSNIESSLEFTSYEWYVNMWFLFCFGSWDWRKAYRIYIIWGGIHRAANEKLVETWSFFKNVWTFPIEISNSYNSILLENRTQAEESK